MISVTKLLFARDYYGDGIKALRAEMIRQLPEDYEQESITGSLCQAGDVVLLVMPQDIQAPKGRLILPQVQTLRELLDKKCLVMSCTTDCLENTLAALTKPPKLIITDSQAFKARKKTAAKAAVTRTFYKTSTSYLESKISHSDAPASQCRPKS